ncbi:response regulator transcription factor [Streptomyces hebeiensis]
MHPARHHARRPSVPRTYITARELEVLRLAANGNSNQQIGRHLGVSTEAVNSRMRSAIRKLRVRDRTHAVAVALRIGLLGSDEVAVPEGANRGYGDARSRPLDQTMAGMRAEDPHPPVQPA